MKPTLALLAALAATPAAAATDAATVARGAYLATAGDCVACHTAPGGKPFAGGRAVASPFGEIYSSNITPDRRYGIGDYTQADFARALRQGLRNDGEHLYPAMPYPSYAKISDADIAALYAYFMTAVPPVAVAAPKTALAWPFSMRWGVGLWNRLFAPEGVSDFAAASDPVARGRYLVEGLGHCGSCHTPRGLAFQEKAYGGDDPLFLAGGEIDGWPTPAIRAGGPGPGLPGWTAAEIAEFLATGRNAHGAVTGEMKLVIEHSTSQLSDADTAAIAAYLKSLPATRAAAAKPAEDGVAARLASGKVDPDSGARLYLDNCAACHFVDARGAPPAFPPLAGNTLVTADNPFGMIHVILSGARLPSTPKQTADTAMPNFDWRLTDDEVAKLVTFVRSSWGNAAPAATADDVAKVRKRVVKENREPSAGPVFTTP